MSRVKSAMDNKDNALAIKLLDAVTRLKPDYVEGWNRRATLRFAEKDFGGALADIQQVLGREPRHFGAPPASVSSCRNSARISSRWKHSAARCGQSEPAENPGFREDAGREGRGRDI